MRVENLYVYISITRRLSFIHFVFSNLMNSYSTVAWITWSRSSHHHRHRYYYKDQQHSCITMCVCKHVWIHDIHTSHLARLNHISLNRIPIESIKFIEIECTSLRLHFNFMNWNSIKRKKFPTHSYTTDYTHRLFCLMEELTEEWMEKIAMKFFFASFFAEKLPVNYFD